MDKYMDDINIMSGKIWKFVHNINSEPDCGVQACKDAGKCRGFTWNAFYFYPNVEGEEGSWHIGIYRHGDEIFSYISCGCDSFFRALVDAYKRMIIWKDCNERQASSKG